jgi:hypothetical protein
MVSFIIIGIVLAAFTMYFVECALTMLFLKPAYKWGWYKKKILSDVSFDINKVPFTSSDNLYCRYKRVDDEIRLHVKGTSNEDSILCYRATIKEEHGLCIMTYYHPTFLYAIFLAFIAGVLAAFLKEMLHGGATIITLIFLGIVFIKMYASINNTVVRTEKAAREILNAA